jgi:hypothetical protein
VWSWEQQLNALASQTTPAEFAALEVDDPTILPAGFPVGEASDAELQDAVFGSVPAGADSNADSGLQVDYGFLPQQGIDMGEPMTTVAGTASAEDDPLGVSSAGIDIGPRIGVGDYALSLGGVGWGLVKSTVTGIWNTGAAIFRPSERLQNLDNLEYADIEGYANYPTEPGLSWETIGDSLSAQIAQSNENARIAKANEDYFSLGMAYSENPLMQMSGLGDLAVFGTLSKFGKVLPSQGGKLMFTRDYLDSDLAELTKIRGEVMARIEDGVRLDGSIIGEKKKIRLLEKLEVGTGYQGNYRQTLAFADVDIPGVDLSRISSFSGKTDLPGFSQKINPENAFFEPKEIGWNRLDDAEAKLYQQVFNATRDNPNISGTVRVVVDRPSCGSCVGAAQKLSEVRPNLNIQVVQGPIPLPSPKR